MSLWQNFVDSHICFLLSEPFLEAIPQIAITMVFSTRIFLLMVSEICNNYSWLLIHKQILVNFSISVISGSLGLSKLLKLKVGPCRLVPYDEMTFGFLVLVIMNASCIIAKGLILTLVLVFGPSTDYGFHYAIYQHIVLWMVICILPQLFFVSR